MDRTINLPQAFNMFDEKLAGATSKHNREEEYSAFDVWTSIPRHRRIMA